MKLTATDVLKSFCETIEATEGVAQNPKGHYEPYGDREWTDLGECYVDACQVLGREPKIDLVDENGELTTHRRVMIKVTIDGLCEFYPTLLGSDLQQAELLLEVDETYRGETECLHDYELLRDFIAALLEQKAKSHEA